MDRAILYQNEKSIKEIYQDFYALVAETFSDRGYKYRKSKHDMFKIIGEFKVNLDYQTFSYNCLGDEIDVRIHRTISFQGADGNICWVRVEELDNTENAITGTFNIKNISHERLSQLISSIEAYLNYMELLVNKFTKAEEINIKSQQLQDPYGKFEYESNGIDYKDTYYGLDENLMSEALDVN